MMHAKHSTPLRVAQVALALLVVLAASAAAGQPASQAAPAPTGPSYGPVLHPQPVRSESGARPEQTPPAPQAEDPAKSQQRRDGKPPIKRSARRSAPLRVDPVAVATTPAAPQPLSPRPAPPDPGPVQINSCLGGACTDTNGATYNTGVGNAAVDSQGRLCTRTANTMQCF